MSVVLLAKWSCSAQAPCRQDRVLWVAGTKKVNILDLEVDLKNVKYDWEKQYKQYRPILLRL